MGGGIEKAEPRLSVLVSRFHKISGRLPRRREGVRGEEWVG